MARALFTTRRQPQVLRKHRHQRERDSELLCAASPASVKWPLSLLLGHRRGSSLPRQATATSLPAAQQNHKDCYDTNMCVRAPLCARTSVHNVSHRTPTNRSPLGRRCCVSLWTVRENFVVPL